MANPDKVIRFWMELKRRNVIRVVRSSNKEILDKSVAVLPFINDSPKNENEYFLNGILEEHDVL